MSKSARTFIVCFAVVAATTGTRSSSAQLRAETFEGTGYVMEVRFPDDASSAKSRSIPLAFGLSALAPGVGQAYNRNWLKAGIVASLEVALVSGHFIWKSRGDDAERIFQEHAHVQWSPGKYAEWINDYTVFLTAQHGASVGSPPVDILTNVDWAHPESWSVSEQASIRDMFNQIRALETELFHPETGATFSHRLPYFAEQQYYELIGKYFQFAPGWNDYPEWSDGSGFTGAIDPQVSDGSGNRVYVSENFYAYASEHAHANDLLRRSSRILSVVVFNHLFSAIDAAVFAKLHNDRLSATVGLSPDAEMAAHATIHFRF